jgi:DNA-binding beta-propeller fold protein YncE
MNRIRLALAPVIVVLMALGCSQPLPRGAAPQGVAGGPQFVADPFWPKSLKENWIIGQVAGLHVDTRDHVWILHRPNTLLADEKVTKADHASRRCCTAAPAVLEFDPEGNLVRGWGGPGQGYDWPKNEHGLYVDPEGYVWVAGNSAEDNMILKFTRQGQFLMQIGKPGKSEGSASRTQLGRPANMELDVAANELYIADGYGNKRILVLDAKTGAYKRHWGAYGGTPSDEKMPAYSPSAPPSKQFANAVHCVRLSKDGLVYVCDRGNNRVQVFRKDGTFVTELLGTQLSLTDTADLVFSPDPAQRHILLADGQSSYIHILSRSDGKHLGSFARHGRQAGQFRSLHNLGTDSKGNLYTGEAGFGRRLQKFVRIEN